MNQSEKYTLKIENTFIEKDILSVDSDIKESDSKVQLIDPSSQKRSESEDVLISDITLTIAKHDIKESDSTVQLIHQSPQKMIESEDVSKKELISDITLNIAKHDIKESDSKVQLININQSPQKLIESENLSKQELISDITLNIVKEYNNLISTSDPKSKINELSEFFRIAIDHKKEIDSIILDTIFSSLYNFYNRKEIPHHEVDDITKLSIANPIQPSKFKSLLNKLPIVCCGRRSKYTGEQEGFRDNIKELVKLSMDKINEVPQKNEDYNYKSESSSDNSLQKTQITVEDERNKNDNQVIRIGSYKELNTFESPLKKSKRISKEKEVKVRPEWRSR